jgi:predicted N-formylglutamate amidohydrolase
VKDWLLIACEHGGNKVPPFYRRWFRGAQAKLASHRGWDRGALQLARTMAGALDAELHYSTTTRLLVDLNRSEDHKEIHSDALPDDVELRERAIQEHWLPYRRTVEDSVRRAIRRGHNVVHISCHSFTPRLAGVTRTADIGLLFDPARGGEAALARRWRSALKRANPRLNVRFNYPYRGTDEGFTTYLRKRFHAKRYVGIEIEVNQKHVVDETRWRALRRTIVGCVSQALADGKALDSA